MLNLSNGSIRATNDYLKVIKQRRKSLQFNNERWIKKGTQGTLDVTISSYEGTRNLGAYRNMHINKTMENYRPKRLTETTELKIMKNYNGPK